MHDLRSLLAGDLSDHATLAVLADAALEAGYPRPADLVGLSALTSRLRLPDRSRAKKLRRLARWAGVTLEVAHA